MSELHPHCATFWREDKTDYPISEHIADCNLCIAHNEIAGLKSAISRIAILAGAGLCQMTAGGKHEFLKDISGACEIEGFDIIGQPTDDTG